MSRIRLRRPSPALVVSAIALIVALGGTSYAAFSLPKNSVGTKQLKNAAVATGKLRNGAVTTNKIGNGAVTTAKIRNRAVTGTKLNLSGVTVPNALHAITADSATNAANATNLNGQPSSAYAHAQALQPTSAFLENGWATSATFGVAGYAKDQFGIVHLFGAVSNGAGTTNRIFTLPAGFRPGYDVDVAVPFSLATIGVLRINPDGTVNPETSATFADLEGITFKAGG
jgi:hypothetical protein